VRLTFTPTVTGDRIHLKVRPEVSSLDFGNGVALSGFRIPALVSRRTETELELRDGQTFAIAGLLNNSLTSTMQKIPGIGDIPILGYLFRSKAANKNQTELVVMITPHILPEGSFGVTRELPRLQEPYLSPLPNDRSHATPPAAFPQPGVPSGNANVAPLAPVPTQGAAPAASLDGARGVPSEGRGTAAVMSAPAAPAPLVSAPPAPTADERKAAERAAARSRKEAEEQAEAEERAAKKQAEEARRMERIQAEAQKVEAERQRKAALEQAKRDAEAAKRQAEEDRRAADEARRKQDEEQKRQAAVEEAAAKLRAAEAAYQAEVGKSSGQ
jgi:hypothetical protein